MKKPSQSFIEASNEWLADKNPPKSLKQRIEEAKELIKVQGKNGKA